MTSAEIIETLRHPGEQVPREALAEVVRRKEEFVPILIAEIEHVTRLGDDADPDDELAWAALFLLAEMREPRALGPILDYLAIDGTTEDDIFGDFLGISGGLVLAAVGHDNPQALREYVRRLDISPWARGAALDALGFQTFWGLQSRESFLELIRELIDTNRFKNDAEAWTVVLCNCLEFHPAELLGSIRKLFERRVVDVPVVGTLQEVLAEVQAHPEGCKTRDPEWIQPITNAADTLTEWRESSEEDAPPAPIERDAPKVGRNDLCPCGSGKKYKKCCLKGE